MTPAHTASVQIFHKWEERLYSLDFHDGKQPIPIDEIDGKFHLDTRFAANHHSWYGTRSGMFCVLSRFNSRKRVRGPTVEVNLVWRFSKMPHVRSVLVVP